MRRVIAGGVRRTDRALSVRSGLLVAATSAALAVVLAGLLTAVVRLQRPPLVPPGVYFGWTDGVRGLFQVLSNPCAGVPGGAVGVVTPDAVVSASLGRGSRLVEFRPPAVAATPVPLTFGESEPVLSFEPRSLAALLGGDVAGRRAAGREPLETTLSRIAVRCRSYAESEGGLGSAAIVLVPTPPAQATGGGHATGGEQGAGGERATGIGVTPRRVPPAAGLLGVLVLSNDTDEDVVLRSLRFAPARASTGTVVAAAGDRASVPAWLGAVLAGPPGRPLAGTTDPAAVTPWDAAYEHQGDPRTLRRRSAEDLDLRLHPGEMAVIVVDEDSLRRTVVARPALLYPVLGYAGAEPGADGVAGEGAETTWVGLSTPLRGSTSSWR